MVMQEAFIVDSFEAVVILFKVHTHHKHGAFAEGAEMMVLLDPPLRVSSSFSMLVKTAVDFTTYLAPASPHLVFAASRSWKMETEFILMTSFPFSASIVPLNLP